MLAADAGAEDVILEDDAFEITTPVEAFGAVQAALESEGVTITEAGLQRVATRTTRIGAEEAKAVVKLLELLEEHQDIQAVYSTMEMDDATIEAIS